MFEAFYINIYDYVEGVLEDDDDRVAAEEHLADVPVLGYWLHLLSLAALLRILRPHLLDIFQHHIAVSVESLDPSEQLVIVAAIDQHLRVVLDALHQHRERTSLKLLLLILVLLARIELVLPLRSRHALQVLLLGLFRFQVTLGPLALLQPL